MKKLSCLFSALFFLVGCSDDNELNQLPVQGEHYLADVPQVVCASIAENEKSQSRTVVDGQNILWNKGDAISFFGAQAHNCKYVFNGEDGTALADFEMAIAHVDGDKHYHYSHAVYPYGSDVTSLSDGDTYSVSVSFPAEQTYAPNSFGRGANVMVAAGASPTDEELFFRNASGYLVVELFGPGICVKTIKLTSLDESDKLAGKGIIAVKSGEAPVAAMTAEATHEVTLDCSNGGEGVALGTDEAHATAFWFALPPVKMEKGFRITVTDMDDQEFVKETANEVEITRNEVQPVSPIPFVGEKPTAYQFFYTTSDGNKVNFDHLKGEAYKPFNANIVSHIYENGLGVITFDGPLTQINKKAFFEKTNLTAFTLPASLREVGEGAFDGAGLTSLVIPGNVTRIHDYAFAHCTSLKSVVFEEGSEDLVMGYQSASSSFTSAYGMFIQSPLETIELNRDIELAANYKPHNSMLIGIFTMDGQALKKVTVGDKVTKIPPYLFYATGALTSITLPSSVTTIGAYAFAKTNITSLILPGSVKDVGEEAFWDCESLTSVEFRPSETASTLTFHCKRNPEHFKAPFNHSPIAKVYLDRNVEFKEEGVPFTPSKFSEGLFFCWYDYYPDKLTDITIGSQVTTILDYTFVSSKMTEITIPSNVTHINDNAFLWCYDLQKITFEEGAKPLYIGYHDMDLSDWGPFYDSPLSTIILHRELLPTAEYAEAQDSWNEGIFANGYYDEEGYSVSVELGKEVKTLSKYMFNYLPIKEITIPAGVTKIDDFAFDGCSKLSKITFEKGNQPLTIGFQPHTNQKGPFFDSPLTYVYLDRELKLTEAYADALDDWDEGVFAYDFWDDLNVTTKVSIQGNVKTIHPYMFSAVRMTSCWIPKEVSRIGDNAFQYCEMLQNVTVGGSTPPALGEDVFEDCDWFRAVYVPAGSIANYKNHAQWGALDVTFGEWK